MDDATAAGAAPVSDILPSAQGGVGRAERSQWFHDHFRNAADEVLDFLAADGIRLEGREVADVGCGDGITDLALALRGRPARLTGYDLNATNTEHLLAEARAEGVADHLPPNLRFETSDETTIPAADDSFDVVVSWSAFEHVLQPVEVLSEIRRVLRPDGVFFLQLWPFFFSEHGAHLWHWFPDGFVNLRYTDDAIEQRLRADTTTDPAWIEQRLKDNRTLNRITLDGLQQAMLVAGLQPVKVEILSNPFHLSPELNRFPLSDLAVSGVKLLAVPAR
jgi:SAM-dependent methyltransferase